LELTADGRQQAAPFPFAQKRIANTYPWASAMRHVAEAGQLLSQSVRPALRTKPIWIGIHAMVAVDKPLADDHHQSRIDAKRSDGCGCPSDRSWSAPQ
jgi:hypothetical protein